jgi:eukaryotic-like serine/threonine-protein kinase
MINRVGQQLGNYRLIRLLGRGAFADVYLAKHIHLNTQAAFKVLHAQFVDEGELENFRDEARTIAQLEYPHIVRILDFGVEHGTPYLVMSYAPNGSLRSLHPRGTIVPLGSIVSYVRQAAAALDYAHKQKVIHRDVKPENMLLGRNNEVLISDFGIAVIGQSTSHEGTQGVAGTVGYMAPEQLQGKPRPASDQYALGIVVYEWLSGSRPFTGSYIEIAIQHERVPPPPLHEKIYAISPAIEQVVLKALAKDPHQRFVSVQAFADALERAYLPAPHLLPTSPATLQPLSTSNTPSFAPTAANQPIFVRQQQSQTPPLANSPLSQRTQPYQSAGTYGSQHRLLPGSKLMRNVPLFLLAIFLISAVAYFAILRNSVSNLGPASTPGATTTVAPAPPATGIGVTKAPDGEYIGVSDGTFAFDTNRPDGRFKAQAADKLKGNDVGAAQSQWQSGLQQDTSDAEALIYLEDQRVLTSGNPYITIVVGTMLTGDNVGVGRDDLQGAYVTQKEFNDGHKLPNNVQVRLLVASSGNVATYATTVAQQIVQAAQQDHTIVGVMGWPFSSRTINAIRVLAGAHIPMVSQTASSDQLTGISTSFFRVVPSNKGQGIAGAHYAEQVLHARNVALFVDPADSYSSSLAADFSQQFKADGNTIAVTENYTVGSQGQGQLPGLLQDALSHNPDLIYFSGYASDISVLLANLPTSGPAANIQILGGDALYELGGYSTGGRANFSRLHFTSFAYPDEWEIAGLKAQKPAFFTDYANAFDPNGQHLGFYGYTRTSSDVMLSYDATLALLIASGRALNSAGGKTNITPAAVQQALTQIKGAQAVQGVSGPIAFDSNGDPVNKPLVILAVDSQGRIHQESLLGRLLVGS